MRILMIQPNYHSGGAEIAGNWPPSWVPYIGGALKTAGFTEVRFVDAMSNYIEDAELTVIIRDYQPDVVLATAITPMIYKSQSTLKLVKEVCPNAITIMGGVHPTYMYRDVLSEAPWVDYIIRGEGEEITVNLLRAIAASTDKRDRREILGIAFIEDGKIVATPAHPPIKDLNTLNPDWSLLDWTKYIYTPLNTRVAVPNYSRGCPFRCRFCSQWKFWRKYRSRTPKQFVDEIELLVQEYKVGFFILADEEPTINKSRFVALCRELIDRNLDVHWGINTRVTDILRDEKELPLYRKAGLVHVSLGTEAAAQLNLNLFRKETTIADNKRAVQLLRQNGILAEVQFIMGLPTETPETIEETYRMARDWQADMTNWNMYTPWPFSELFQDLADKVEIRDYSHYNFVTPIIKPDQMTREEVLKGVLRNYARFYSWKFLEYWFEKDPFKRRYLLGCLWAFVKTTLNKRFYNLKRVKQKGLQMEIEFGFDESRILSQEQMAALKQQRSADVDFVGTISACGGPNDLPDIDTYFSGQFSLPIPKHYDTIQVALVEDDQETRINLRANLRAQNGIEVASEATNGETGLVLLESIDVDVAVVDSTLPDMDLAKFIRSARKLQANSYVIPSKILVLVSPDSESVSSAIAAGADGISLKDIPIEQLANAVRIIHQKGKYQDPALGEAISEEVAI
ncbi:MAG TPA: magnesium-protoporphyrin IX monomethyl ester anaerobic oxidative cyclase [Cyanobacteria bacterium UBA11149]|nr:magnesium-protoporphyrin IX monomethyl ester anaerobic oxidative cyclase [Cyanobacteria bacterium UBA11366]HBR76152.1 magnesium-protoporphyrin IX monomethyl ester anaerobic oxidative cyclase [Cyanobacteria bacterium UBA11159]HBS72505.1 magnesium-protoporphyrin IX monomethyl ester anaerobic oxidative cyclase [Cyanobacteria bacterium UBA11153]HBW87904.1 magnesium-protoporphyrin IX monomethyl ester anaerobic oxidative cyclase [Cyanobacteria bacterium UBA11149]HCA97250.1 magnesium-protoporphyrin